MFFFRKVDIPTIQYCKICVHENESKLAATWCPNVKISCVPTVACTIPDLHQVNNTS